MKKMRIGDIEVAERSEDILISPSSQQGRIQGRGPWPPNSNASYSKQ